MPLPPSLSRRTRRLSFGLALTLALGGCGQTPASERQPFTPSGDDVVLEHVPAAATDAKARERAALRRALAARADQLDLALRLARLDIEEGRASGDPRYLGRAQAALAPWWGEAAPPPGVRLLRATILQGRHEFPAALQDLDALVRESPDDAQAWLTRAVVLGVRGEHAEAGRSCVALTPLAGPLAGAVCQAQVKSLAGRSKEAVALLSAAMARGAHGAAEESWALSTLAEATARAGDTERATKLFARVLALDPTDAYTRAAYADLLLDLDRPKEVVALTKDHGQDDNQLLRRVLAEVALGSAEAPGLVDELASRHAASHLRGDSLHAREEARFALGVQKDAGKALRLAQANWQVQHEPWDARILLEAALAHHTPDAGLPAVRFLEASGADDPGLLALADRVRKALPMKALAVALWLLPLVALAHKPSDSYLHLDRAGDHFTGRWDVALRDLEEVLVLDANGDGALTWGELRAKGTDVSGYVLARLKLSADGAGCPLSSSGPARVVRHSDGAYVVVDFSATCPATPAALDVDYTLLFDRDPQHRGIVRVGSDGADEPLVLSAGSHTARVSLSGLSPWRRFGEVVASGVHHIWAGIDHLMFLLALLLPSVLRRDAATGRWVPVADFRSAAKDVVKVVSAFTLAHSLTLSAATLGWVSLPSRLVESAIAASVVVAALNNVFPLMDRTRWLAAFVLGLLHGFGFASVLVDLGLPTGSLAVTLLGFNVGVELGQLACVAAFLPLAFLLRATPVYRRALLVGGSAAIALVACAWFAERAFGVGVSFI